MKVNIFAALLALTALQACNEYNALYKSQDYEYKYEAAKAKCPKQTREFIIEGGNHAQFGAYGAQKGDGVANISNSEQWAITAFEVLQLFA